MNKKLSQLSEKRERLVNQAAQQRVVLRQDVEPWRAPLALADQGISALRYVRRHPQWIVGFVIVLAVARPARVWKWLQRGLVTWQMAKTLGASKWQDAI